MKLSVDELHLEHFRSWVGPAVLDVAGLGAGLHFIRGRNKLDPQLGSNGAGKSSLWGALTWCLYGRTPEGLHNVDIKPWRDGGSPAVTTMLHTDDQEHLVTRTIGNLVLDGRTVGQEQINELLGMSYEVFINAVVMGQGQPLFPDLTPAQKMRLFDDVMQLDRWIRRSKHAASRRDEIENRIAELKQRLATLDGILKSIEQSIKDIGRQIEVWEKQEAEQARDRMASRENLEKQLHDLELRRDAADLAMDSALTELRPLQIEMRKIMNIRGGLELAAKSIGRLEQELAVIEKKKKICPVCKQPVQAKQVAGHKTELLKQLTACKQAETALAEVDKKYAVLEKAELDFQKKSDLAQWELNDLNPKIGALKQEIEQLQNMERDSNPHRGHLRELYNKLNAATEERADIEKRLRIKQRGRIRTEFWVKGFREVRLFAIEEVLQELELQTNSMLEEVGLVGWEVRYAIERETKAGTVQRGISSTITCPANSGPVKWQAWSGGECQRLRIICSLALSEVLLGHAGIATGIEILDEPTQHLSGEGIDDLIDYLSERARQYGKTILYADQHSIESARFASVLTVLKTKQGSKVIRALQ